MLFSSHITRGNSWSGLGLSRERSNNAWGSKVSVETATDLWLATPKKWLPWLKKLSPSLSLSPTISRLGSSPSSITPLSNTVYQLSSFSFGLFSLFSFLGRCLIRLLRTHGSSRLCKATGVGFIDQMIFFFPNWLAFLDKFFSLVVWSTSMLVLKRMVEFINQMSSISRFIYWMNTHFRNRLVFVLYKLNEFSFMIG